MIWPSLSSSSSAILSFSRLLFPAKVPLYSYLPPGQGQQCSSRLKMEKKELLINRNSKLREIILTVNCRKLSSPLSSSASALSCNPSGGWVEVEGTGRLGLIMKRSMQKYKYMCTLDDTRPATNEKYQYQHQIYLKLDTKISVFPSLLAEMSIRYWKKWNSLLLIIYFLVL